MVNCQSKESFKWLLLILVSLSLGPMSVWGAGTKDRNVAGTPAVKKALFKSKAPSMNYPQVEYSATQWVNEGNLAEIKQLIHKLDTRKPAAATPSFSADLERFRADFQGVKTANDLSNLIEKYNGPDGKAYETLSPDLQYVVAQLTVLRPFRAIVQKIVPLFHKHRMSRAFAIYGLTQLTSIIQIELPTPQWQAGFDFVAGVPSDPEFKDFQHMIELQNWLASNVYKEVNLAAVRLAALGAKTKDYFYFDKSFLYNGAKFEDAILQQNQYRYRPVGPAEISAIIAALEVEMHNIKFFAAYNRDDHFEVRDAMVADFMRDSLIGRFIEGINDKVRVKRLRVEYPNYLTLLGTADLQSGHEVNGWWGRNELRQAGKNLVEAANYIDVAWTQTKNQGNRYPFSIVGILLTPPWTSITDYQVQTLKAMVKGETTLRDVATDDYVVVNLPKFYQNPIYDLKDLLPTSWHEEEKSRLVGANGKSYNNYRYNTPKAWNQAKFEPWLKLGNTKDVGDAVRSLSQSWGGLPVALPMVKVIR